MQNTTQTPSSAQAFWDPVGEAVTVKTFVKQNELLQERLKSIQQNPYKLKRNRSLLWLLACVGEALVLFLLYLYFSNSLGSRRYERMSGVVILPFLPVFAYIAYIKKLQNDLVCSLFAQTHGWVYNPDPSQAHWKLLAASFPAIFNKGHSQYVEDEFWGSIEVEGVVYNFWKAPFVFTEGGGKHSHTYTRDAIAFRLPRKFDASLILTPEGFHLFGDGKDDVKTESVAFNHTFTISCPGMNESKRQDIVRALSPAVQTRLLDLHTKRGNFSLELQRDMIVFSFERYKSPLYHTDFFRKVEIDPRDTDVLQNDLRDILSVTSDMLRYMD